MEGFSENTGPGASSRWGCFQLVGVLAMALIMVALVFAGLVTFQVGPFAPIDLGNDPDTLGPGGGPAAVSVVPPISDRTYGGGSTPASVGGAFAFSSSVSLNTQASITSGYTWLQYGDSGSAAPSVLITFDEDSTGGVSVAMGPWIATGTEEQCSFQVQVTLGTVSGHVSCAGVAAYNSDDGSVGVVDIELDFTADS